MKHYIYRLQICPKGFEDVEEYHFTHQPLNSHCIQLIQEDYKEIPEHLASFVHAIRMMLEYFSIPILNVEEANAGVVMRSKVCIKTSILDNAKQDIEFGVYILELLLLNSMNAEG